MSLAGARRNEEAVRKSLRALIQLRLVVVTAILGLGIVVLQGDSAAWNKPFFIMLGITAVLSVLYWIGVKKGKHFPFQAVCLLSVDMGLATVIIHYTGDFTSPFALLYILIISAGSRFLLLRGTVVIALLCAAVHGAHLSAHLLLEGTRAMEVGGALPTFGLTGEVGRLLFLQVGLYTITFVFLAVLSGYLSVRIRRGGEALDAARTRLRRARLNTDQILRSLSSGLLTVDQQGLIVHFNRAAERIIGLEARTVIGRKFERVLEPVSPPLVTLLRGIQSGWNDVLRQETTLSSTTGDVFPIGMSASPLRDEEGKSAGVVCIFQDLTDVRRMEEHIRHVDRLAAVGELSAGIAHEIRNPLATISGSVQVLQTELSVNGENGRLLEIVVRESDRLHQIVEDFLDFARTGPIEKRMVNLGGLIVEVGQALENHPKRGPKVNVRFEGEPERYSIVGDGGQLQRVFLNLAVNAFEAIGDSGTLTVGAEKIESFQGAPDDPPTSAVAVCFRDTGPGVPGEFRDELFRPFFTTKKGGVGLGLALAQKIVVSHGGKIEAEGDARGATFTVYLPWRKAMAKDDEQAEPACETAGSGAHQ